MSETKQHWRASEAAYLRTAKRGSAWCVEYDATPGGRRNPDGTTSYSVIFPVLVVTDYVNGPEKAANDIAACLNAHHDLLAALKATLGKWVDLVNSGDAGFWNPEEEDHVKAARAAIANAEARQP